MSAAKDGFFRQSAWLAAATVLAGQGKLASVSQIRSSLGTWALALALGYYVSAFQAECFAVDAALVERPHSGSIGLTDSGKEPDDA